VAADPAGVVLLYRTRIGLTIRTVGENRWRPTPSVFNVVGVRTACLAVGAPSWASVALFSRWPTRTCSSSTYRRPRLDQHRHG